MVCGACGSERRGNWIGCGTNGSLVFSLTFVLCSCVLGRDSPWAGQRDMWDIHRDSGRAVGA
jgi:hypothetical protein